MLGAEGERQFEAGRQFPGTERQTGMKGQEPWTRAGWGGGSHCHSSFTPLLHKEAARVLLKLTAWPQGSWQWDGQRRLQGVWCSGWPQDIQEGGQEEQKGRWKVSMREEEKG